MKLEPNTNYWRGQPPLDSVTVKFVPDNQARILAVQNDEAMSRFIRRPKRGECWQIGRMRFS
jgi:ABC-type transport system substrate-binding protein